MPGNNYEFTQPIQMRFNELISGVRSDVAVKVFGDDLDALAEDGERIAAVLQRVPGAADVKVEQITGLPMLTITSTARRSRATASTSREVQDRGRSQSAGARPGSCSRATAASTSWCACPRTLRERHRLHSSGLPLAARLGRRAAPADESRPAAAHVADARELAPRRPNQISRENGKRRVVVSANVRGRDLGSFVAEARAAHSRARSKLPAGYWIDWGGQFEQLHLGESQRLRIVVPVALLLIFVLLFAGRSATCKRRAARVHRRAARADRRHRGAGAARHSAVDLGGVGFIALSGVAVLNGLVMISFMHEPARGRACRVETAVREGALTRLRPVLMTALVASLGFVPMALATGPGAEVQRPLATVVIGGIVSSTLLTLFVLPVLYRLVESRRTA